MRNTPEESERNGMFDGDETRERDEIGQMREAPKENKKVEKVQIIERDVTSSREGGGMARVRD